MVFMVKAILFKTVELWTVHLMQGVYNSVRGCFGLHSDGRPDAQGLNSVRCCFGLQSEWA